ncbi:hypothetical protein HMPREF1862_00482 [Varibaculum cambriense]|uniref:Uncharacterized protein n=1 Tax=Varibaculum cambriense TaxID=184870 RepID=A0AB34X135_9ACTO|nr:hypothetical protein HMPREF1862_00482 [Varibaculum cambriense]
MGEKVQLVSGSEAGLSILGETQKYKNLGGITTVRYPSQIGWRFPTLAGDA